MATKKATKKTAKKADAVVTKEFQQRGFNKPEGFGNPLQK